MTQLRHPHVLLMIGVDVAERVEPERGVRRQQSANWNAALVHLHGLAHLQRRDARSVESVG